MCEQSRRATKPFFLYLSYTAPPLAAACLPEDVEKYEDTTKSAQGGHHGQRYRQIKQLGIFPGREDFLSQRQVQRQMGRQSHGRMGRPRDGRTHATRYVGPPHGPGHRPGAGRWKERTDGQHADHLPLDNGCSSEQCRTTRPVRTTVPTPARDGPAPSSTEKKEVMPGRDLYASLGAKCGPTWPNTPFRFWKPSRSTAALRPRDRPLAQGLRRTTCKGRVTDQMGHVSGHHGHLPRPLRRRHPTSYDGNEIIPLEGKEPRARAAQRPARRTRLPGLSTSTNAFISKERLEDRPPGAINAPGAYNLSDDHSGSTTSRQRTPPSSGAQEAACTSLGSTAWWVRTVPKEERTRKSLSFEFFCVRV